MRMSCPAAAALAAAFALCSCAQKAAIIVDAGGPGLERALEALATEYSRDRSRGLAVSVLPAGGALPAGSAEIRIGWETVPLAATGGGRAFESARIASAAVPTATCLKRNMESAAAAGLLPLLWDAWGVSAKSEALASDLKSEALDSASKAGALPWSGRGALARGGAALIAAGADPGTAQFLFAAASSPALGEEEYEALVAGESSLASKAAASAFASLAALARSGGFRRDSMRYSMADAENIAATGGRDAVVTRYGRQRSLSVSQARGFRVLALPASAGASAGYALCVSVLAGRADGEAKAARRAQDFLLWLLEPARQRVLSEATGLLAVNFNAPSLDPAAAGARAAAIAASSARVVDPEPDPAGAAGAWCRLLSRTLSDPSAWEKLAAEAEGGR